MSAKQKPQQPDKAEPAEKAETQTLVLTQDQHFALSDKEKTEFRAKGGTVSNQ